MIIYLIRHGLTEGNLQKRYIGRTEEPLCPEGIEALKETERLLRGRGVQECFVSPSLRCRQTAQILFPALPQVLVEKLKECDFGEFEGKNYRELSGNMAYQAWIDSGGTLPFPGGEGREDFRKRSLEGFYQVLEKGAFGEGKKEIPGEGKKEIPGREKKELPGEDKKEIPGIQERIETQKKTEKEEKESGKCLQKVLNKSIAVVAHGGTFMNLLETLALMERSFYDWHLKNGEVAELKLTGEEIQFLLRERPLQRCPILRVRELL